MEVLVTGGNGFVGHHLVQALLDRGDEVRILALPDEDIAWARERGVRVHRGDICQYETLATPMHGVEAVVHLAGMMHVMRSLQDYYSVNVTGTENVCKAALAAGVRRVVHMSSSSVYGMNWRKTVDERFQLSPFNDRYPLTKAEGDRAVQRMIAMDELPAVIIRPDQIFGPGDRLHFGQTADRLSAGKAIIVGPGDNALPLVFVADVVQGLLLALDHERAAGEAFNITNDAPITQQQFLEAIASEIGAQPPRLHIPYHVLYAAACAAERIVAVTRSRRRPPITRLGVAFLGADIRFSIDKARRMLGFAPQMSLYEGIGAAAAWYRAQGQTGSAIPGADQAATRLAQGS